MGPPIFKQIIAEGCSEVAVSHLRKKNQQPLRGDEDLYNHPVKLHQNRAKNMCKTVGDLHRRGFFEKHSEHTLKILLKQPSKSTKTTEMSPACLSSVYASMNVSDET